MTESEDRGHGWWPYLVPYLSFLLAVELSSRLPEGWAATLLFVKPMLPLLAICYFWRRGAYPELRTGRLGGLGASQDVLVGVALAALWIAPYIFFPILRPENPEPFNPDLLGKHLWALALSVRLFGYAIVTPLFEELFIRSFVMRYSEVYWERGNFRDVPLAHYSLRSFLSTVVIFSIGHVPWEWWVAVPWIALTNIWFYYRRNLWALILVHGVTNATLLGIAVVGGDWFHDANGAPISLWFFV